ncbi:hypothetical protein BKI52_40840 [marine bacterium AO1-C]|nr:hypothetical protein BKI52_40840 [marine bacterium AO1-C]
MLDYTTYWYLLPLGILIATLYNSTGISGANFWIPVFILLMKVSLLVAFWLSLVAMLFGSIGGLIGHSRQGTIVYSLVKKYILVTIPFAVVGACSIEYVNETWLLLIFGIFALVYGSIVLLKSTLLQTSHDTPPKKQEKIKYPQGALGGFLVGMVSVGLGPLILPCNINHQKVNHHAQAIGTTVIIVFISSLSAVLCRLTPSFLTALQGSTTTIMSMFIYVIPGVLIGGQIGPIVAKKLNLKAMRIYVSMLLLIVGGLMFVRFFGV